MKAAGSALALALVLIASFGCADAVAAPSAAASGRVSVSLTIPPRIEIRQDSGSTCAQALNESAGTLTVLTESGAALPACNGEATATFERVERIRQARVLLVTPV